MAIILDADVVIAGEKGHFDLQRWLVSHAAEQFEIAAITVAELWHGVERATGTRRARRRSYLKAILSVLPVIPLRNKPRANMRAFGLRLKSWGR